MHSENVQTCRHDLSLICTKKGEGGAGRESTGLHEGAYTVGGRGQGGAHRDSDKRKRPACRFRCMCILRAGHRRHGKIHTASRSMSERERVALSRTSTSAPWPSQLSLWILSIAALGSCCSHMPDSFWHRSSVHSTRLCREKLTHCLGTGTTSR